MTNTIRLNVTCFCHNMQSDDTQCYIPIRDIGVCLASCYKDEIWDLRTELGLIWEHFRALVPMGPSPKFATSLRGLFLLFGFFLFQDQIFRNRDFFPRPNFFETETETFFPKPNFLKPKPRPFPEPNFSKPKPRLFFRNQIF